MPRKLTTKEFIEKSVAIHGDKYNYSNVVYKTNQIKVKIICPEHGEFSLAPCKHLQGRICPICSGGKIDTEKFIDRANIVHNNKYDYSLSNYNGSFKKISIICPEHKVFYQTADRHLQGAGCPKCGVLKVSDKKYLSQEEFVKRAEIIHDFKYNYSTSFYLGVKKEVEITCREHGIFKQMAGNHLAGKGCPICCESKGEREIRKFLKENKIKFISQKKFKECKNILPLPFDFYLPEHNIAVEYDGRQHFESVEHFGGEEGFKNRIKRDQIKTVFCKENNIALIRINKNDDIKEKLQFKSDRASN